MAKRKTRSKSKKSSRLLKTLFIFGLALISVSFMLKINTVNNLSFASTIPPANIEIKKSNPKYIVIQSAGISLPVEETVIAKNAWQIGERGASHLGTSASPGESGNIIIYAHNTKDKFGNLSQVKKGEIIKLYSEDHKVFTYEVTNILVVNPTEISVLHPTKSEIITIYTCTGFADLKRLVIKAIPLSSESLLLE